MIYAVDFDGTLAETDYPRIIAPKIDMINALTMLSTLDNTIILNTCRHGEELNEAVAWCKEQGLIFDYINENAPEMIEKYGDCRKIYADFYIDDHNITFEEFKNFAIIETVEDEYRPQTPTQKSWLYCSLEEVIDSAE